MTKRKVDEIEVEGKKEMGDEDVCAICIESIGSVNCCTTECNHRFHLTCMAQHLRAQNNCPMCRAVLETGLPNQNDEEGDDDDEDNDSEMDEENEKIEDSSDQTLTDSGHTSDVYSVVILSENRLASCSFDKSIKIWNLSRLTCEQTLTGHTSVVYSLVVLSENRLASASADHSIKIWDLSTFTCQRTLIGHTSVSRLDLECEIGS